MSEPNYIKCNIYTMDGKIKYYNAKPSQFPFDYIKYLYRGELYFQERLKDGKLDNKVIYKEDFDLLVNAAQNTRQVPPPAVNFSVAQANSVSGICCPRCRCQTIAFQREQYGNVGTYTNKVYVVPAKKSHGCFYWLLIGWWWVPMYWLCIGWWYKPLFGRRNKGGLGFNAGKTINRTVAVCQNCGYSWNV